MQSCDLIFNQYLPFWRSLDPSDCEFLCHNTQKFSYKKGETIHDGGSCTGVFLIKKGCLRVYILSEEGKEITLYRLFEGDVCMLSASCVLQAVTFEVFVDAEEDSECYLINGNAFMAVNDRSTEAQIFALELAVDRFSNVMWVLQQVLFMSFDKRLAIFLWDEINKNGDDTVKMTHEQIAKYMGSAREVVSRMLKYFAAEGIVEVSRGGIKIINRQKLRKLAL